MIVEQDWSNRVMRCENSTNTAELFSKELLNLVRDCVIL